MFLRQKHVVNSLMKLAPGIGNYEGNFCEFILYLGQWFRRCFKYFLSTALVVIIFGGAEQFRLLVEGIMMNICVKLFLIWANG